MPKIKKQAAAVVGLTAAQTKRLAELNEKVKTERLSAEETGERADLARIAYVAEKKGAKAEVKERDARIVASAKTAKKAPRKLAKKSAPAKAAAAPAGDRIPLKAICQKLDIDPKRARVALRRRLRAGELAGGTHEIGGGRWMLTPSQAERVRESLKEFLRSAQ